MNPRKASFCQDNCGSSCFRFFLKETKKPATAVGKRKVMKQGCLLCLGMSKCL